MAKSKPNQPEAAAPEVQPAEPAPEAPKVEAAPSAPAEKEEKLVKIRVRDHIPRTCIGGQWYSFQVGKEARVPANVAQVLKERNLL